MNLPHGSVQDNVAELKRRFFPGYYVLPYNRFDVERSQHWWLSPTPDKVAFRCGKAIFTTDSWVEEGKVFCGFNVEKGVLHKGEWKATNVMDKTWFWHRFLDLANAPFAAKTEEASRAVGEPLQIYIACGPLMPGNWDQLWFEIDGSTLNRARYLPSNDSLKAVANCVDFSTLADTLRAINGSPTEWYWLDLLVGTTFTLDAAGPDDTAKCAEMLNAFVPWMK